MKLKIYLPILLLSSLLTGANLPSTNWQKQDLTEKIKKTTESVLSKFLAPDNYNVNIKLEIKNPSTPNFYKSSQPSSDINIPQTIVNINNDSGQDVESRKSKAQIKFTDEKPKLNEADYVFMRKFGLEAPLIDDFNNLHPNGKIVFQMESNAGKNRIKKLVETFENKEKKYIDTIKELKSRQSISPIEQTWKYNNSIDIFNNLKKIEINITLSKTVASNYRGSIEKAINSYNYNLPIAPKIVFTYGELINLSAQKSLFDHFTSFLSMLSKFSTLIGIITGIFLFSFIANKLLQKYFEFYSNQNNNQSISMDSPQQEEQSKSEEHQVSSPPQSNENLMAGIPGVDRFRNYIKSSERGAVLLLKRWICDKSKDSINALRALVQLMDNDELVMLFPLLTSEEKEYWKSELKSSLDQSELAKTNDFISSQIVQDIIVPNLIDDPETFDLILKISPSQMVLLAKDNPHICSLLMNALSISFVNDVFSSCSLDVQELLIKQSILVTPEEIISSQQEIKNTLTNYVESTLKYPFLDKIVQLLPHSTPLNEHILFESLATYLTITEFKSVTSKYFPSDLIKDLPDKYLSKILTAYPLQKKSKLLKSLSTNDCDFYISKFAKEGSKAFDMISVELDSLEKDPSSMENISNNKDSIWKEFVDYIRRDMTIEKDSKLEITKQFDIWATNQISKHQNSDETPKLSVA